MRIFTIKCPGEPDQSYRGFGTFDPTAPVLLIVTFDGEPDMYSADKGDVDAAIESIKTMYAYDYGRPPEQIAVYKGLRLWMPDRRKDTGMLSGFARRF